jgi:hypothetical protein
MRFSPRLLMAVLLCVPLARAQRSPDGGEFFENRIRPLLAAKCYGCHGEKTASSGLRLDSKAGWERGGSRGPAIVPGDPEASLIVRATSYRDPRLQMPPGGRLADAERSDLAEWVRMGAPDPRAAPPGPPAAPPVDFSEARKFWAFQPVRNFAPPAVKNRAWVRSPVDAFLLASLEGKGLAPAPPAEKAVLLRRVTFDLIGLPPTPEEIREFLADRSPNAYEKVVDRLLASPHYGERWARHWLDLVRFAETSGHEFDFEKQEAWRYRDYVIRAFNQDLPYDQFIKEHIAGDLLVSPRLTPDGKQLDTPLATSLFGLGEERNGATDLGEVRAEKMDSRIDVFGKAFLGLTIACARCHDHKFDPIPTADYYSLGGIFESTQLVLGSVASPSQVREAEAIHRQLASGNEEIRALLAGARLARAARWKSELLEAVARPAADGGPWAACLKLAARDPSHPYYPLVSLAGPPGKDQPADFPARLTLLRQELRQWAAKAASHAERGEVVFEDFDKPGFENWHVSGLAFSEGPLRSIPPNQAFSGPLSGMANSFRGGSDRPTGTLMSRSFRPSKLYIHVRLAGTKFSPVREHPSLLAVTIFANGRYPKGVAGDGDGILKWKTITLHEEVGQICNLEIADRRTDGHIVVDKIVFSDSREPPIDPPNARIVEMLEAPGLASVEDLAAAYQRLYLQVLSARQEDAEAQSLAASLSPGDALESDASLLADADRRRLEELRRERASLDAALSDEPFGMLAAEDEPHNLHIYLRGNHLNLGPEAPRGFLRILAGADAQPYTNGSGRLALADALTSPNNPLTARVMVNRIWQHHFGEGLVRTVDNFGKTGERPTHPELLDFLAWRFRANGWSVKAMHREMALSSAYGMSSVAGAAARQVDPDNRLLSHMPVRRLEGEVIRDAILAASGSLDPKAYGPSVPPHISAYQDGRGKPASGPLDGAGRRGVYLEVRRNFITPLFLAFDYPLPSTTVGRRSVSTVPSQALMLMNNEFVGTEAAKWAGRAVRDYPDRNARLDQMFLQVYARPPDAADRAEVFEFLGRQAARYPDGSPEDPRVWADLAHVLFNSKEFIFVR